MKYVVRGLWQMPYTGWWFQLLSNPAWTPVVVRYPRLHLKLQRPYLRKDLPLARVWEILRQHYTFLLEAIPEDVLAAIYSPSGYKLLDLNLERDGRYALTLSYQTGFEREGDLVLSLHDSVKGRNLVSLALVINRYFPHDREITIASIQTNQEAHDKEEVVALTRTMHGLRPKALLVFALQELAVRWNIQSIRAVGNSLHIWQHWARKKNILLDYDTFWMECRGKAGSDGLFDLPLQPHYRSISEIKPNKRSLYKQRYAFMAKLSSQIRSQWPAGPHNAASDLPPNKPIIFKPETMVA
jgi:uncharacterized protein VirK/YbjX